MSTTTIFFCESLLQNAVAATTTDESRKRTLLKLCDTRWVEKHSSVLVFRQLFAGVIAALEFYLDDKDADVRCDARIYLRSIMELEFAIVLIVVSRVFALTKPYSEKLQEPTTDLISTYVGIEQLATHLAELQNDCAVRDKLFGDMCAFLGEHDIPDTPTPRRRQQRKTCRELFDTALDTFISATLDELGSRFAAHQQIAIKLALLLPNQVRKLEHCSPK